MSAIMDRQEQVNKALEVLKENGYIMLLWHKDDVQMHALDTIGRELTDDELNNVIIDIEETDCNIGVNWSSVEFAITSNVKDES